MTDFKPMLAAKAKPEKIRYPVYVQAKLDGIRCCIVNGKALTRTLKEVPNREIFTALSRPEFEGLDGELIVGKPTAPDCYRQTSSYVMASDKTGGDWCFHVFDRWDKPARFEARSGTLCALFAAWQYDQEIESNYLDTGRLFRVPSAWARNAQELEAQEAAAIQQGHEGVILRDPYGFYKFGRSSVTGGELLKLKRFDDFEAIVVGVYEELHNGNEAVTNALGRTERSTIQANKTGKGRLGGLILQGFTNGEFPGVQFRCGTGFSAAERENLWQAYLADPDKRPVGHVAKIKYFPVGAKDKPRFPTFLGWRDQRDM